MSHSVHHDARPVSSLNLNPSLRAKLAKSGYRTVHDLEEASPVELSKELGIPNEEAVRIFQQIRKVISLLNLSATNSPVTGITQTFSAAESLERERQRRGISTSSTALDDLLGGSGVPVCKITEFCGEPGIGKTQLGCFQPKKHAGQRFTESIFPYMYRIQLSVNVQIPAALSGAAGEAIYIALTMLCHFTDTEGSFIAQRVAEMAGVMVERVNGQLRDGVDGMLTLDTVLSRIHYFRVHDFVELLALMRILDEFLKSHPKVCISVQNLRHQPTCECVYLFIYYQVKLVVVDSIAFHFRLNFPDMALRTRLLNSVAQTLMQLASDFDLAVVLMNQMTTKLEQSKLVPALGMWILPMPVIPGHICTQRPILANTPSNAICIVHCDKQQGKAGVTQARTASSSISEAICGMPFYTNRPIFKSAQFSIRLW
ncbi:hypothetical protein BC936DRAFT_138775 [Jimgerdemannia flammicorona]|uniref:DNA repair protein RAD51 homolog 3 n=1 Tax=Jimgerdemannia flammicorona TaxID=994334 RepID=A0A433BJY2_9FUNG|nr:hypothetical protein BC936DRAFT_138775 [Jimgerdemannia flammicorona]